MATRRLLKERAGLEKEPLGYCTFELVDEDIHHWRAFLLGPPKTPFSGGTFVLDLNFPAQYPFKPPDIRFVTQIFHPNVKTDTGEICNDLISEGWGPTLNVRHCIQVLRGVLENPDADHPIEMDIATMMRDKPREYEKTAAKHTKDFAMAK